MSDARFQVPLLAAAPAASIPSALNTLSQLSSALEEYVHHERARGQQAGLASSSSAAAPFSGGISFKYCVAATQIVNNAVHMYVKTFSQC